MHSSSLRTAATVLLGAVLLAGCTTAPEPAPSPTPAEAQPVALGLSDRVTQPVRIGLIAPPVEGEGADNRLLAEGAGVAVNRFALSGARVDLVTVLDDGSVEGTDAAMRSLIDQKVAGVVMAASGSHVTQALKTASAAQTPVIMPYGQATDSIDGVWSIAPSPSQIAHTLAEALADAGATHPVLVAAAPSPAVADIRASVVIDPDSPDLSQTVLADVQALTADSVVIEAPAATQADLVAALQSVLKDRQIPILLTPQALTPVFSRTLVDDGAATTPLITAGMDTDDLASLTHGEQADATAAFLAALRLGENDPNCRNIYGDDTCSSAAGWADIASHDAVVALVRAVERAGSTAPAEVSQALVTSTLTAADGLAGPVLDFAHDPVVADSSVVALHSTTADPKLRPAGPADTRLFWFAGTPS